MHFLTLANIKEVMPLVFKPIAKGGTSLSPKRPVIAVTFDDKVRIVLKGELLVSTTGDAVAETAVSIKFGKKLMNAIGGVKSESLSAPELQTLRDPGFAAKVPLKKGTFLKPVNKTEEAAARQERMD